MISLALPNKKHPLASLVRTPIPGPVVVAKGAVLMFRMPFGWPSKHRKLGRKDSPGPLSWGVLVILVRANWRKDD